MQVAAIPSQNFADRSSPGRSPEEGRPIDLVHLARATDGDEALEAELLSMFDRQSEKLVERLKLPELPRRARADVAHRLRGSALAIGAFEVAEAARSLEAVLESEGEEPEAEIGRLAEAVAKARGAIADLAG